MSGSFELFNGDQEMRITEGARTVFTTEGTLINLLPPEDDISLSFSVVFPDFTKDYLYNWRHQFSWNNVAQSVGYVSACATQLAIPAQEFADEVNLVAAPAETDIFVGSVLINRTAAPSHTWNANTINPLQPMNVRIPFVSGSLLMEAEIGMARAFSVYVSGGQLKLHRQQSVSTPPGGYGDRYGTEFLVFQPMSGGGGENVYASAAGLPVHAIQSRSASPITIPRNEAPPYDERTRRGGSEPCSVDTSGFNYSSTYSVQLTGSFGRRS